MIEHCEDLNLSAGGDMHEGAQSVRWGLRGIPAASEDVMVARDMLLAELTGARYPRGAHFHAQRRGHGGLRAATRAAGDLRGHAAPLRADRRPDAAVRQQLQNEAAAALRGDRDAIVEGSRPGAIDAIATDHAPHPGSEKMQEFERCPFGIIGLETAIALALEELVAPGKITLTRLVELFTTGPESVMRLGRGTLAPGAPGDVTVFSTDVEWTYDVNQSRSRNSPFHGRTFHGGPMATVVSRAFAWKR